MKCKDCKYYKIDSLFIGDKEYINRICDITHLCNTKSCPLANDAEVEDMKICYNCRYWIGGGDWGLSCQKDYYNCSTNGFNEACEQFERKTII